MQRITEATGAQSNLFQSSSGPGTGCNDRRRVSGAGRYWFQSSSGPGTGCNRENQPHINKVTKVSILIRSGDRMQRPRDMVQPSVLRVSILIRSGDRMQRRDIRLDGLGSGVSILIRSGDRMQRRAEPVLREWAEFQSSSGPGTGCNRASLAPSKRLLVSILIRSGDRMQPRPRGAVATRTIWFQSSSGPGTGCNDDSRDN